MNPFSEELRKDRETKHITLTDISLETRINIKYLQAIEQGAFDVLPQTYVRAFIKAYADAIGVNSSDALKKYDIHSSPEHKQETETTKDEARIYLHPDVAEKELKQENKVRMLTVTAIAAVAALLLIFFLLNYFETVLPTHNVKETPFQEVVKEQEQLQPQITPVDSVKISSASTQAASEVDSLALRVIATDSVWITIIRDTLPPRTGYMLRGRYRTYVAHKQFSLSLSDAGSVKLILNGEEIFPIGEKGKRVRNIKITSDQLKK